jgi:hypothetical protein
MTEAINDYEVADEDDPYRWLTKNDRMVREALGDEGREDLAAAISLRTGLSKEEVKTSFDRLYRAGIVLHLRNHWS